MVSIKQSFKNYAANSIGKRTKHKMVALLVDDFGGVRTKNNEALEALRKAGITAPSRYLFDTLASKEDLSRLFDVLTSVKDSRGHYACITPFANIANPDFERIKQSGFTEYFREPFTTTLDRYGLSDSLELWKQGIAENIFHPEYHGTEHIDVRSFIRALKAGHKSSILAFENECLCCPTFPGEPNGYSTKTFHIDKASENESLKEDIRLGLQWFNDILGYRPSMFAPGACEYSPSLHEVLADEGIKYIDVLRYNNYPLGDGNYSRHFLYTGKKTSYGQYYYVRNSLFEPINEDSSFSNGCIEVCMSKINAAFSMHCPAIIASHRVNYVTGVNPSSGEYGLMKLKELLNEIKKRWPDVLFVTGNEMMQILFEDSTFND